jgi:VCBS repeat-containing protein
MIRAHRVEATAHDDASLISGWNVAPNVGYSVALTPGPSSCGVFLFAESGALVASGAALVGTEQPCVLIPQWGQIIGMIDAELGWHMLLTTIGTESQRTIRINPAVDLPDEIHPIYGDDDLALVRATAGIDASAHYIDDLTVSCPLGLGAGLGDVASVPVDGFPVAGQVESITWAGTPNGATEQAVVRRHVAIAPTPAVAPPAPPVVVNDTGETAADETTSGNVMANDATGLTIVAVNGLSANVGVAVAGNNGGVFVIASNGAWTFDPDGDFAALTGSETATTSVTYHASDGTAEASATVTVTVSSGAAEPELWTPAEITSAQWIDLFDSNVVSVVSSALAGCTDKSGNSRNISQSNASLRAAQSGSMFFWDGSNDLQTMSVPQSWPAHIFAVLDLTSTLTSTRQIFGRHAPGAPYAPAVYLGGTSNYVPEYFWGNGWAGKYSGAVTGRVLLECILGTSQAGFRVNGGSAVLSNHSNTAKTNWTEVGASYTPQAGKFGLGEYIIVNGAVSDADREKIEGYLAHKWDALLGITTYKDALPSGHPYKTSPPTI